MKIYNITESFFNEIEGIRQIIMHEHPRRFAALELDERLGIFGLGWRSDKIEPIIQKSKDGLGVWVGVDQYLVAIDLRYGRICLSLPLNTNLLQLLVEDTFVAVLTEN